MLTVKSLDDTINLIKAEFSYDHKTEFVNINNAAGRILASDIMSLEDCPHFRRSSLDGYAVNARDTFGAGESIPAMLKLTGEVKMNSEINLTLQSGEAIYVPTGGYIPEGADAVAMIEIVDRLDDDILISKSVAPGTGIILRGDDVKAGETVLKANQVITSKVIGTFAALGYTSIPVKKKLKCGIISTGDELVPIDALLCENISSIRDVNSYFLKSQAEKFGCEAVCYGIFKDDKEKLINIIKKANEENDIILISGGSSVGIMDMTKEVFKEAAGAEILVHGIAVKPGKPTIIARAGKKALIGLPGHPVSAFFIMQQVVRYVINTMYGIKDEITPYLTAKLTENIVSNNGRDEFIPVRIENTDKGIMAQPIKYKSGLITLLSKSDGYIRISRYAEGLDEGTKANVYLF